MTYARNEMTKKIVRNNLEIPDHFNKMKKNSSVSRVLGDESEHKEMGALFKGSLSWVMAISQITLKLAKSQTKCILSHFRIYGAMFLDY